MARGSTIEHLENVQLSFEGLRDLFEKETRSPGIKACYELDEIRRVGVFVLTASARGYLGPAIATESTKCMFARPFEK